MICEKAKLTGSCPSYSPRKEPLSLPEPESSLRASDVSVAKRTGYGGGVGCELCASVLRPVSAPLVKRRYRRAGYITHDQQELAAARFHVAMLDASYSNLDELGNSGEKEGA